MDKSQSRSAFLAALVAVAVAGCGSSTSTTVTTATSSSASQPTTRNTTPTATTATTTPASTTAATTTSTAAQPVHRPEVAKIRITSPAVQNEGLLPARYTCTGQDISPPLSWTGIPPGTKELALLILNLNGLGGKLFYEWAVAGLNPNSQGIPAGKLPSNTITGTNSYGKQTYHLCQPKHTTTEQYVAILYALPHKLKLQPGFNATNARLQALNTANYSGHLFFSTTR
jgi:hypothetical protein